MTNTPEPVIEIEGLETVFGDHVVHRTVELSVARGEVIGIIGGSGCGKSVLLRTIVGLRQPDAGSIRLFGVDRAKASQRERQALDRRFGLMFQDGALFSSLTVLENVKVPLIENHALPRDFVDELAQVKMALAQLGPEAGEKFPSELSGGMRKRAGLARALALDPEILFLDEPTSGLDPIAAAAIDDLIGALKRAMNLTVVVVTHDLDSLYTLCDRVAVLADRRVAAIGTLAELERSDHPWVRACLGGPRGRGARDKNAASSQRKEEPWKPVPTTS